MKFFYPLLICCLLLFFSLDSKSQCTAEIEAEDSTVCENSKISFKLKNLGGTVASVDWDFGFKQVNSHQTPTIIYNDEGKYDVVAHIKWQGGGSCKVEYKDWIEVKPNPVIEKVIPSTKEVCDMNDGITFESEDKLGVKWEWIIEGKYYETNQAKVNHEFEYHGYPLVQLTVVSQYGCTSKAIFDSMVHVLQKPTVSLDNASKDFIICDSPAVLTLKPLYTLHNQNISSYNWSFPNATIPSDFEKNPSTKTYLNSGKSSISLNLKTTDGCTFKYLWKDIVKIEPMPSIKLISNPIAPKCDNHSQFYVSLKKGVKPDKVLWEFPKSEFATVDKIANDSFLISFNKTGDFKVFVNVVKGNCAAQLETTLKVTGVIMQADFLVPLCICQLPDSIQLISKTENFTFYDWEVEGANNFFEKDNKSTFDILVKSEGSYKVKFTAMRNDGCKAIKLKEFEATNYRINEGLLAHELCLGDAIITYSDDFNCEGIEADYSWELFDENNSLLDHSTNKEMKYNFTNSGNYFVAFKLAFNGCEDSVFYELEVNKCKEIIELNSEIQCAGLIKMPFSNTGSNYEIEAFLIRENDELDSIKGNIKGNEISFNVKNGGIYDLLIMKINIYTQVVDTQKIRKAIYVSSLKVEASIGDFEGCFPNKMAQLWVTDIENIDFVESTIAYYWQSFPTTKSFVTGRSNPEAFLTLLSPTKSDVQLTVTNASGCKAVWQEAIDLKEELKAQMVIDPYDCMADTLFVTNTSVGKIDKIELKSSNKADWVYSPKKNYFEVLQKAEGQRLLINTAVIYLDYLRIFTA